MKTRRFTVLLATALLLAACGAGPERAPSSTPAGNRAAITFAAPDGLVDAYRDLVAEFEGIYPDVRVSVVSLDGLLGPDLQYSVSPEAASRVLSAADTAYWTVQPAVTRQGLVRDLTPFLDADPGFDAVPQFDAADFYPGLLDACRWDGGTWAVPGYATVTLFFYDKAVFDQAMQGSAADLAYPRIGWTWDDFVATAKSLTERNGDEVSRYGYVSPWGLALWFSYLADHGLGIGNRSGDPLAPLVDSPDVAAALRWYDSLVHDDLVMPCFPLEQATQAQALVADSRAAMWTDDASNYLSPPAGSEAHAGRSLGAAPFPSDGSGNTNPVQPLGYVMSAGTARPEAAWRWLSFLSRQGSVGRAMGVPARRSVAEASGFWNGLDADTFAPLGASLAEALRYAMEHPLVANPTNFSSLTALGQALNAVVEEGQDIDQALVEAQQTALVAGQATLVVAQAQVPAVPPPVDPGGADDEAVTITFINSGADPAAYRALAEGFHKIRPDIDVEVRPYAVSDSSAIIGIEQMAAAGDCFRWLPGFITQEDDGYVLSLDPFLSAAIDFPEKDYYSSFWQMCEQGGRVWCLPYSGRVGIVHYNRTLFDAAGVPYPEADWTLDDLVQKALALTQGEGVDKQYGFSDYANGGMALEVVVRLRGGELWDTAALPPYPQYDDPAVVAAVRWYAGLAGSDGIRPVVHLSGPMGLTDEFRSAISLVEAGKVAMWVQYGGFYEHVQRAIPSLGTVPFPQYQGHSTFAGLVSPTISRRRPNIRKLAGIGWCFSPTRSARSPASLPAARWPSRPFSGSKWTPRSPQRIGPPSRPRSRPC